MTFFSTILCNQKVASNLLHHSFFLTGDWSADDELQLLEAIEIYGLGNWRDISNYLGGSKTDTQCARHYTKCYLESPIAPIPSPMQQVNASGDVLMSTTLNTSTTTGGEILASSSTSTGASSTTGTTRLRRKNATGLSSGAVLEGGLSSVLNGRDTNGLLSSAPSMSATGSSTSATGASTGGTGAHLSSTPGYSSAHVPRSDIVGYMPLRGDFDLEYDNDAEVVIADMDFQEGEHSTETELKLKILEIYNAKLDERERRKAFIIERGLLDYKRLLAIERRRPRDEREVYDAFRPFARFSTPQEHEDLVRGIILEQRLRKRIAQLQEYRRNGIRSLAEAHEYDVLKRKREQINPLRITATKKTPTTATVASASANDEKGRRSTVAPSTTGGKRKREEPTASPPSSSSSKSSSFVIADFPGANLLSEKEKSLCEALRLLPSQYQQIKATIVNIALARGYVKRSDAAGKLVHIDAVKIGGVYDFVVSCGWAAKPRIDEGE